MGLESNIRWDKNKLSYIGRTKVKNQTIEISLEEVGASNDTVWFNIVLTAYNKRKDYYKLHDHKTISGKYPFETIVAGLKLFDELEKRCLNDFDYLNVIIYCTWSDNRRRDAYWSILKRRGYKWGNIDKQKVIMKRTEKK